MDDESLFIPTKQQHNICKTSRSKNDKRKLDCETAKTANWKKTKTTPIVAIENPPVHRIKYWGLELCFVKYVEVLVLLRRMNWSLRPGGRFSNF